jgi:hypothetical protein
MSGAPPHYLSDEERSRLTAAVLGTLTEEEATGHRLCVAKVLLNGVAGSLLSVQTKRWVSGQIRSYGR